MVECVTGGGGHPAFRGSVTEHGSPFPQRHSDSGGGLQLTDPGSSGGYHDSGTVYTSKVYCDFFLKVISFEL